MMLRAIAGTQSSAGVLSIAANIVLSLCGAFAGSLAAVLLVPLVQPGHPVLFGGALPGAHASIQTQVGVFAATTGVFALLRWLTARLGSHSSSRFGKDLRNQVHARLIEAPLSKLADSTAAEIANVLTYNAELMTQGFSALLQLLVAGITTAVSLGFACWISPPLVLAAPLFLGVGLLASRTFGREQSRVSREYVADLTRLFRMSEDFPQRLRHVRSFGRVNAERAGYDALATRLCHGYQRQQDLVASGRLVVEVLTAAGIAAVLVVAQRFGGVDQPELIAVCLLLGRLLPYLASTRQSFQQMRSAVPAFELWSNYMNLDVAAPLPATAPPAADTGSLWIECIRLTVPAGLEVRNLALVPGTLTVIYGDSGIGKSSLVDVLAGMMTPETFVAYRNEQALSFCDYRELVRRGAYVSQNVRPWQHSVRECLLWASPRATDEMMRSALADLGLDRRLLQSGHGLDTTLHSSSSRLSGGELQRLMLAQVILRQPALAVLDEATSALDAAAERAALAALRQRLPQTILIAVSHRTSVSAVADQCLRLGDDRVGAVTARCTRATARA